MAFINKFSCECSKSETDLFSVPPTQTSILKGQWIQYNPLTNIVDSDSIEFNVTGSSAHYLDLAHSMINVKAKIVNEDGTDLADDAQVGPVNLFLHSLFSEVDITLNDRLVSSATNNYAYRAIIESLLSFGDSAKKSQLISALFFKDTAGRMNQNNPVAEGANNEGLKQRYQFTKGSQVVDLFGPIHSDIFFQDRLLLNGVSLKLKFHRSKNVFVC